MAKRGKDSSKFNVSKDVESRTYNGIVYDSKVEMMFYRDYILPKIQSGEIVSCESQVPFELQPSFVKEERDNDSKIIKKKIRAIDYVADYEVTYNDGHKEVIDIKGHADSVALLKRKMFWYKYPDIIYRWISYSKCDGGWIDYEDLKKARAIRKKEKMKAKANMEAV